MLASGKFEDARVFCRELSVGPKDGLAASGHACLANIALASCESQPPAGACVDEALAALDAAIEREPQARRLHLGRLRVLLDDGRAGRLATALEDSLARRPGTEDDVDKWLGYAVELVETRRLNEAVAYTTILSRRFPDDASVLATLGGCLIDLGENERAEPVLNHALALHPDSPAVNWSLAWLHERTGRVESARRFFEAALAGAPSPDTLAAWSCAYASVLESHGRLAEACRRQREHCPPGAATACSR